MGIIIFAMSSIVSIVIAMCVGGLLLPTVREARRTLTLLAAPADAFSLLASPERYADWRDDVTSTELAGEEPLRWHEYSDNGAICYVAAEQQTPTLFVAQAEGDGQPSRRSYTLQPAATGTLLTYSERRRVLNPLSRFISRYLSGPHRAADVHLLAIAAALNEHALPRQATDAPDADHGAHGK